MATINNGYVSRRGKRGNVQRNWWLVKHVDNSGRIEIGAIRFPLHFIGKRIKLKIEEIDGQ